MLAYEAVAASIVARHLQTPIDQAVWADARETASRAHRRLSSRDFDQAPVRHDAEIVGYVATRSLAHGRGLVEDYSAQLDARSFEAADAPVTDVVRALLPDRDLVFVVDGHRISGFITPSDLNKHPARAHFYLLLADLEMTLASSVTRSVADLDSSIAVLEASEQKKIRSRFKRDQRERVEVDLAAAMDLGHLLSIAVTSSRLRRTLRIRDVDAWHAQVDELVDVRNAVMHPTKQFLGGARGLQDLVRIEESVREMIGRLGPG